MSPMNIWTLVAPSPEKNLLVIGVERSLSPDRSTDPFIILGFLVRKMWKPRPASLQARKWALSFLRMMSGQHGEAAIGANLHRRLVARTERAALGHDAEIEVGRRVDDVDRAVANGDGLLARRDDLGPPA